MAKRIRESNYTAFVNANDPGKTEKQLHEGWFQEALDSVRPIEAPHDISQYFRYAPQQDKDEFPVELISWGAPIGTLSIRASFPRAAVRQWTSFRISPVFLVSQRSRLLSPVPPHRAVNR